MQQPKRITRTYVLPASTAASCKTLAAAVGCNVSHIVETLLEKALEEIELGRWSVEAYPIRFQMRLNDGTENRPKVDRLPTQ